MNGNVGVVGAALLTLVVGCAKTPAHIAQPSPATVLWREPAPAAATWRRPVPPFTFVEEDMEGDSPKFFATDADGTRWQVKLGPEAQTEAVAIRLLTELGYFAEETHFIERIQIAGIEHQKRGREFVSDGIVRHARFEARRETVRRGEAWDWARNPFVGTTELDALRAMMVLLNNYDARTGNNRIIEVSDGGHQETRYVVADLGASFGHVGGLGGTRSKNNLEGYRSSPFIERVEQGQVYFAYRTRPEGWAKSLFVLNPIYTAGELKKERDLAHVPVPAARWLGHRLAAVPPSTLREAFDDAGYTQENAIGFVSVLIERINRLSKL